MCDWLVISLNNVLLSSTCLCVFMFFVGYLEFGYAVLIAWKVSSLKRRIICGLGHKSLFTD